MSKKKSNIIGRAEECSVLQEILSSKDAEFVAIYGRRRVGKTFLVDEFFKDKGLYFSFTGQKDASLNIQLSNFAGFLTKNFHPQTPLETPKDWNQAFSFLMIQLEALPKKQKIILFLDEIPWIATKRSKFIQALDYFWNTRLSKMPNLKLIVCGSAASWILDNLIHAKGGLYNRLTRSLLLLPFNLKETRAFLSSRGIKLQNKGIADLYLVMGGVPHYLKQVKKGRSAIQNINDIFFQKDGLLYGEFLNLFRSLFDDSEIHLKIVRILAKHHEGVPSLMLAKAIGLSSGGSLTKKLAELEASGIIQRFVPYGRKIREHSYRLIDEYCLFYLSFIEPLVQKSMTPSQDYWQLQSQTPRFKTWAGYAFENLCYKHANQILVALNLSKIACEIGTWRSPEAQIDLLFDRSDGAISLCEIKYSENLFTIDKTYAAELHRKMIAFEKNFKNPKQLFLVLICASGLKQNLYAKDLVAQSLSLSALFEE